MPGIPCTCYLPLGLIWPLLPSSSACHVFIIAALLGDRAMLLSPLDGCDTELQRLKVQILEGLWAPYSHGFCQVSGILTWWSRKGDRKC